MRGPRLFDHTDWKSKKVFVVRDEGSHFLQGSRLQPTQPIGKSGPARFGIKPTFTVPEADALTTRPSEP